MWIGAHNRLQDRIVGNTNARSLLSCVILEIVVRKPKGFYAFRSRLLGIYLPQQFFNDQRKDQRPKKKLMEILVGRSAEFEDKAHVHNNTVIGRGAKKKLSNRRKLLDQVRCRESSLRKTKGNEE